MGKRTTRAGPLFLVFLLSCHTGVPTYIAWRAGTTTLCQSRLYPQSGTKNCRCRHYTFKYETCERDCSFGSRGVASIPFLSGISWKCLIMTTSSWVSASHFLLGVFPAAYIFPRPPDNVKQGDVLRHLFPYTSTCQGAEPDSIRNKCRIRCICIELLISGGGRFLETLFVSILYRYGKNSSMYLSFFLSMLVLGSTHSMWVISTKNWPKITISFVYSVFS
jgi:hypothetical protein